MVQAPLKYQTYFWGIRIVELKKRKQLLNYTLSYCHMRLQNITIR